MLMSEILAGVESSGRVGEADRSTRCLLRVAQYPVGGSGGYDIMRRYSRQTDPTVN
jgi:hypothetical protein